MKTIPEGKGVRFMESVKPNNDPTSRSHVQAVQEHLIIFLLKKDGLPIVPALDHVMGIGREAETRLTRHSRET